jgi:Fe2+ transport system protein B
MVTIVQEEEVMIRDQDVKEIKDGMKELNNLMRDVDKTVTIHTEKFNNLGNIKEQTERTSESTKSAHKRIDKVELELREEINEIRQAQEKQYIDFKKLVENSNKAQADLIEHSNKVHTENYKGIKAFGWKVFFLFAAPWAVGFVSMLWLIFNKGLGFK